MATPAVTLDAPVLTDPEAAVTCEWLETNGTGAYAMSTPILLNTRKYHSLLTVHPAGLDERYNLLSHVDLECEFEDRSFWISTNQYPSVFYPRGFEYASEFVLDLYPRVTYSFASVRVSVSVIMPFEQNTTLLRFDVESEDAEEVEVTLRLKPFLAYRVHHALARENSVADLSLHATGDSLLARPYPGLPELHLLTSSGGGFGSEPDWYRCFLYSRERERGYEFEEDLMTPGQFVLSVRSGAPSYFVATIDPMSPSGIDECFQLEVERRAYERERLAAALKGRVFAARQQSVRLLGEQSRHFLISPQREAAPSIVAGFPWFGEWGRDSMIALEGLTLDLGKHDAALDVLETFARFERDGLFPNMLNVTGTSSYNTVDASLWYFHAVDRYLEVTGDREGVLKRLFPAMERIVTAYFSGSVPNASIVENGMLQAGSADTQLTWMDASVGGVPVTPRFGFPVEIEALWYHALRVFLDLADPADDRYQLAAEAVASIESTFLSEFWVEQGYLADVVRPDGSRDESLRPNQIVAAALKYTPLDTDHARKVVATVESQLLTPFGIRTLTRGHPSYVGRYRGTQEERDRAYHQGTVWPWLLGPFCDAVVRHASGDADLVHRVSDTLETLLESHARVAGLGSVSEVLDGDHPYAPGGCPHQAWSVAGVLHAALTLAGGS